MLGEVNPEDRNAPRKTVAELMAAVEFELWTRRKTREGQPAVFALTGTAEDRFNGLVEHLVTYFGRLLENNFKTTEERAELRRWFEPFTYDVEVPVTMNIWTRVLAFNLRDAIETGAEQAQRYVSALLPDPSALEAAGFTPEPAIGMVNSYMNTDEARAKPIDHVDLRRPAKVEG